MLLVYGHLLGQITKKWYSPTRPDMPSGKKRKEQAYANSYAANATHTVRISSNSVARGSPPRPSSATVAGKRTRTRSGRGSMSPAKPGKTTRRSPKRRAKVPVVNCKACRQRRRKDPSTWFQKCNRPPRLGSFVWTMRCSIWLRTPYFSPFQKVFPAADGRAEG